MIVKEIILKFYSLSFISTELKFIAIYENNNGKIIVIPSKQTHENFKLGNIGL